jgi:hypothetical protein
MYDDGTTAWILVADHSPPGTRCLADRETVYNDTPLTPDAMRSLGHWLIAEADTMDARHEGAA